MSQNLSVCNEDEEANSYAQIMESLELQNKDKSAPPSYDQF